MNLLFLMLLTAVGIYILLLKAGIRNFTDHSILTDIIVSSLLAFLFMGTMSGMVIALGAGIFISLFLWITKISIGKSKDKYLEEEYFEDEYFETE